MKQSDFVTNGALCTVDFDVSRHDILLYVKTRPKTIRKRCGIITGIETVVGDYVSTHGRLGGARVSVCVYLDYALYKRLYKNWEVEEMVGGCVFINSRGTC